MTLLEVLVATTLMVIISVISYTGLNGLIDAKIHTDSVADDINRERLTTRQLTKDIKSIINRSIISSAGEELPAILGRYNSIEFSLNGHANPLKQKRSELYRVSWIFRNGQLIRRSIDYLEAGSQPAYKDRIYLDNLKEFNISYLNRSGQKVRNWPVPSGTEIPKFIQLSLIYKDNTSINLDLIPNGSLL